MKSGIYKDLTNETYHTDSAVSRSGIMTYIDSPYKYWAHYINPNRPLKSSTKAMDFGSAFHTFILQPELFWEEYAREPLLEKLPEKVLLKNVGRPAYEAYKTEKSKIEFINAKILEDFEEETQEKLVIIEKDLDILNEMKHSLINHPEASALIAGAIYEQSYFWEDKESGLMLKARPDILHDNMVIDLKTCANASSRAYQRTMIDGGYHIQGAMIQEAVSILEGREIDNVINICIEKTYPYEIGIKIISADALKAGRKKFLETSLAIKHDITHNEFKSNHTEIVELPSWAL
jgi:hypothetical protein